MLPPISSHDFLGSGISLYRSKSESSVLALFVLFTTLFSERESKSECGILRLFILLCLRRWSKRPVALTPRIRFTPTQQALPLFATPHRMPKPARAQTRPFCVAIKNDQTPCLKKAKFDSPYCGIHERSAEKRKPAEVELDDRTRLPLVREPAFDHQRKKTKVEDESAMLISRKRKRSEMEMEQE